MPEQDYDCIIIGAGPGGLQAAIHLARFNRRVILIDQGGGRTRHALHLENYLGLIAGSGKALVDTGIKQIQSFGVTFRHDQVSSVQRDHDFFVVGTGKGADYRAPYLILSTGGAENLPRIMGMNRFFGRSIFTCVDCDGYHTTGKKLVILGRSLQTVRLALAMKQMFTPNITLVMPAGRLPDDHAELLAEDEIRFIEGEAEEFLGDGELTGVKLTDGRQLSCQVVMLSYSYILNDSFLTELSLQREADGKKLATDHNCETSTKNLFALGALRAGNAQAIIAAGQGAMVGIEINQRLLEL
ncbi:NAD(P)/FAD-dependent oxidoreductase [Desulfurivibrio alkaliphilus]|uniref:FAD-dependent pyridine nucleotide-disulfide oxidoreductase n=1 Tax=Desulfurivibrio alkaliphilus (strain DSM 19089 / UNIQEM U267 / AHT2) TaxID=589865 RepID=D6Z5X6_DESAT|nr:NAD(P)/FAD-dependent oxidoreductase [Desulfurivibrio alkaliphilus]ADH84858.1 FAD-dependent pyridine nucleotide-disulfide oxidoreductase [Desulfurivibrio alkaliphilus AHT 2]